MDEYIRCFACGAKALNIEGECHEYMLSSPGCYAMFTEVLEKEYSLLQYAKAHQFTVDAYACQHVGSKNDVRAMRSVNIHLASLYAFFEKGLKIAEIPEFRNQFSQYYKQNSQLKWLKPPISLGNLTIFEVWNNEDPNKHYEISFEWAKSVWNAWSQSHKSIAKLVQKVE